MGSISTFDIPFLKSVDGIHGFGFKARKQNPNACRCLRIGDVPMSNVEDATPAFAAEGKTSLSIAKGPKQPKIAKLLRKHDGTR